MAERPAILRGAARRRRRRARSPARSAMRRRARPQAARHRVRASRGPPTRRVGRRAVRLPAARRGRLPRRAGRDLRPAGPRSRPLGAGLVGWRRREPRSCSHDPPRSRRGRSTPRRGAGPFAFSDRWVVVAASAASELVAQPRDSSAAPREVARAARTEQLGRPSIVGDGGLPPGRRRTGSQIRLLDLATGRDTLLRSEHRALLINPSLRRPPRALRALEPTRARSCGSARLQPRATTKDQRLYTTAHRPPRRRPREGPPPPPRRLQGPQAAEALAPPARRHHRHAVDHGARPDDRLRDPAPQADRAATTSTILSVPRSANVNCGWVGSEASRAAGPP